MGNLPLLREKVLSIVPHVGNQHFFPSNEVHKSCEHGDIDRAWVGEPKVTMYCLSGKRNFETTLKGIAKVG